MIEFHYIECGCSSADHVVRFWHDDEINVLFVEAYQHKASFWRRLKTAIKYIMFREMPCEWVWDSKSLPGLKTAIEKLESFSG